MSNEDDWMHYPLCKRVMGKGWKCGEMGYCSDECMVLGSWKCGAAVAFGLMGMAEAIRCRCTCAKRGSAEDDWADLCEVCKGYP